MASGKEEEPTKQTGWERGHENRRFEESLQSSSSSSVGASRQQQDKTIAWQSCGDEADDDLLPTTTTVQHEKDEERQESHAQEGARKPKWIPLESNPAVLNKFIYSIGVDKGWAFADCYGLSSDLLAMLPTPCLALLLLFPTNQFAAERQGLNAGHQVGDKEAGEAEPYFMRQHVRNACGSIAVIHAVANNRDLIRIEEDSGLHSFLEKTKDKSPHERGTMLGYDEGITQAHRVVGERGQTNHREVSGSDFHFICFTSVNNSLYEFDGTKEGPIKHCPTTRNTFLQDAAQVIQLNFINKCPGELYFNLIALVPSSGEEEAEIAKAEQRNPSSINVATLLSMGFEESQVKEALTLCNDDLDGALALLCS
ncbi:Ubiquitin carboxyl-terminal hydrolase isozyme L3 [Balamuthia mandrillaris]